MAEIIGGQQYRDKEVRFSISPNINHPRMAHTYLKLLKLIEHEYQRRKNK